MLRLYLFEMPSQMLLVPSSKAAAFSSRPRRFVRRDDVIEIVRRGRADAPRSLERCRDLGEMIRYRLCRGFAALSTLISLGARTPCRHQHGPASRRDR